MPLRRNQKIGIAAAGGAAAIGLTAAIIYAVRRPPKCESGFRYNDVTGECEPLIIVGDAVPPTTDPLAQAKRRFCMYPNGLTIEQLGMLEESVFAPLVVAAGGMDWSGPYQIDTGVATVAQQAIQKLCLGTPRPRTRTLALELARSAWWAVTGQTGQ